MRDRWSAVIRRLGAAGLALTLATGAGRAEGATTGETLLQQALGAVRDIDTAGLQRLLAEHPETVLIDVRTPSEVRLTGGTIGAFQNRVIPRGWLEFRIGEEAPDRQTPIVVYCGTNQRSPLAARTLMQMGYAEVWNYGAGFFAWQQAGLEVEAPDRAPQSALYRLPQPVAEGVWSAIGALQPRTYDNNGHNNNLSFIVTAAGVVVVNAGDNYLLAAALHDEIRKLTDQPVKYVVLENGQGHAALGSSYWREQGAKIVAHQDTLAELKAHGAEILDGMRSVLKDKAMRTELALPDIVFEDQHAIELGGTRIEVVRLGPAHSPGDISVVLPQQGVVIAGDIAFHQRMLPVFEDTDTAAWIETWKNFEALQPRIVVPGHGDPTTIDVVREDTVGYLTYLRGKVKALVDNGGDLQAAYAIDQSPYRQLKTFRELAKRNAERVFRRMEFE